MWYARTTYTSHDDSVGQTSFASTSLPKTYAVECRAPLDFGSQGMRADGTLLLAQKGAWLTKADKIRNGLCPSERAKRVSPGQSA